MQSSAGSVNLWRGSRESSRGQVRSSQLEVKAAVTRQVYQVQYLAPGLAWLLDWVPAALSWYMACCQSWPAVAAGAPFGCPFAPCHTVSRTAPGYSGGKLRPGAWNAVAG